MHKAKTIHETYTHIPLLPFVQSSVLMSFLIVFNPIARLFLKLLKEPWFRNHSSAAHINNLIEIWNKTPLFIIFRFSLFLCTGFRRQRQIYLISPLTYYSIDSVLYSSLFSKIASIAVESCFIYSFLGIIRINKEIRGTRI